MPDDAIEERLSLSDKYEAKLYRLPPDDHPVYSAIGRVEVAWAVMSKALSHLRDSLVLFKPGAVPGGTDILRQLLHEISRLIRPIPASNKREIEELIADIDRAAAVRNRIAHDTWAFDVDAPDQIGRNEANAGFVDHSISDLNTLRDSIRALTDRIHRAQSGLPPP